MKKEAPKRKNMKEKLIEALRKSGHVAEQSLEAVAELAVKIAIPSLGE